MATKADLQAAHEQCERIRRGAFAAEHAREYLTAIKQSQTALQYLHPSVSFQRRYLKVDTPTAPAADTILRLAPAFFQGQAVDAVLAWYEGGTKTERASLPDMPRRVDAARQVLAHAVELWGVLAEHPSAVLRPPTSPLTTSVVPIWVAAGAIALRLKESSTYIRASDPRREAVAKCAGCGRESRAPLAELLEPTRCPACERRCAFVIIRRLV